MSDTAKLIEELAACIEAGKSADFSRILELHGELETLHKSLLADSAKRSELGPRGQGSGPPDRKNHPGICRQHFGSASRSRADGGIAEQIGRSLTTLVKPNVG